MVDFQYKENQERFLIKKGVIKMMTYSINVNDLVWCDKCTNEVIVSDGEDMGIQCPTCQTGFYLETL
jgi:ribosomal protein S27E